MLLRKIVHWIAVIKCQYCVSEIPFFLHTASPVWWQLHLGGSWSLHDCRADLHRGGKQRAGSQYCPGWKESGTVFKADWSFSAGLVRKHVALVYAFLSLSLQNIVRCMGWNLLPPLIQVLLKKEHKNLSQCLAIFNHLLQVCWTPWRIILNERQATLCAGRDFKAQV